MKEYNEQGKITFEGTCDNYFLSRIDGNCTIYYEDGKLAFEGKYTNKKLKGNLFDKNGEIMNDFKIGKSINEELETNKILHMYLHLKKN